MSPHPTHIGIAFYTLENYPTQWVIVLSSCPYFHSTVWCGTVIESVNGWEVSWRICEKSPSTFAPYTSLLGVVKIGAINKQPNDIVRSTSTLAWTPQRFRDDGSGKKYPPTDEYVRQVIFHLCNDRTITLPPRVKVTFSTHIEEQLSKIRETPPPKIDMYPIIPIGGDEIVFVGKNARDPSCLDVVHVITTYYALSPA